jgi:(2R)-3-sulfolactate dehydrogenase (NADP+)
MATLTLEAAEARVAAALARNRTAEAIARVVARALVAAEADGLAGHGLARVASYAAQARVGKIDGFAEPVVRRPRSGVVAVDAAHGFAYPALAAAVAALPDAAAEVGLAAAPIRRSHHAGAAGHPVEALAEAGLVALMFANSPPAIAPWGGKTALFGTNPIAFAAPLAERAPLVVDLSLSRVARGNVVAAKQRGEAIPEGWAFDAEGRATTDADAALAGTMAPLGDAKGTALALMVELLAAALTGANVARQASSFLDAEGPPPGTGQLLVAFDPAALGGEEARARITALAAMVEAEPGARLPGARRLEARARARADGLEVADDRLAAIDAL